MYISILIGFAIVIFVFGIGVGGKIESEVEIYRKKNRKGKN